MVRLDEIILHDFHGLSDDELFVEINGGTTTSSSGHVVITTTAPVASSTKPSTPASPPNPIATLNSSLYTLISALLGWG